MKQLSPYISIFFFLLLFTDLGGQVTYTVNTTDDLDDGVCDGVHCSLREAIDASNGDGVASNIHFNIQGFGPFQIIVDPNKDFLNITEDNTQIDGTTQPGNIPMKGEIELQDTFGIYITLTISGNNTIIRGINFNKNIAFPFLEIHGNDCEINSNYFHNGGFEAIGGTSSGTGLKILNNFFYNLLGVTNPLSNLNEVSFIKNKVGINPDGEINPMRDVTLSISSCNSKFIDNEFYNGLSSVLEIDATCSLVKGNLFFCNEHVVSPITLANAPPTIDQISPTLISGSSSSEDTIEIYLVIDSLCTGVECQGGQILGITTADNNGKWSIPIHSSLKLYDRITAIAYNSQGQSSLFGECKIVLPDNCKFAERLPVNDVVCSTTGIVLDLKQLTLSQDVTQSTCGSTLINNDAWYQIEVPSNGNFLVRSNINNTVNPVIEAYTGTCGNLNLIDCAEIDSLPKAMTFENYTPGNTIYLRVWDKNNTITDSDNTALLHLTAHELPLNKDEWEICDQENNLINGNPTILSERDANSFILEYEPNATPADIAAIELELQNEGATLTESCLCNGAPLQLWKSDNPIDTEDRRRGMKRRANVDTTNYNYVFETVEFQVNAYAIGEQYATDVAMANEGDFAMVWTDQQRQHNYGRVYKSSGNPITQEFQLGASDKIQFNSSLAMEDDGSFIAVWHEINPSSSFSSFAVMGRQYDFNGIPKGASFNISNSSANTNPSIREIAQSGANAQVAIDGSGNFIVLWNSGLFIFAQRFDNTANLIGSIIQVGPTITNNISSNPSIGVNNLGEFIIVWNGQDADETGIYAQRYSEAGLPIGAVIAVNTFDIGNQGHPDVVLANDGSFIITWESFEQEGAGLDYGIYAQRFDSSGNKVGAEFLVNSYTTDAQRHPSISLFDDGSFVIAWSSKGQDGFEEGIYAKVFDANGNPINPAFDDSDRGSLGEEFRMNTYEDPEQENPSTATNGSNIMIGAWVDGANDGSFKGIFAQRYEILPDNTHTKIFYPIGTATPSTLLGDQLDFPPAVYTPTNAVKKAKVAIIDTGIDEDHTHLVNALWSNPAPNDGDNCVLGDVIGYDFVNESGNPIDVDGHGTKVSGIVTRDFDTDVQLELMSLKFHELNRGKVFDAICAIHYAVDNGAEILNLSWGFEASEFPTILNRALRYASDKGVLVITTAGNTSKNNDKINKFPANLDIENMIVVTAYEYRQSDGSKRLANYASYGQSQVDIAAYGFVESPKRGGGLEPSAGTSLAAPLVARTAATIKGLYPVLTAAEIKDCILSSAEQVPAFANLVASGGILDHDAALICAQDKFDLITTDSCANSGLTATPTIINESCTGMDGVISLSTSGTDPNPTFLWSTADTASTVNNLMAGNYAVTITDTSRCVIELNLSVGMDCSTGNCQTNLVINDNPIMDSTYLSDNTITSSGIIPSGGTVTFKAEESIKLLRGFHATTNSDFLATIETCPTNSLQTLPQELTMRQANFQSNPSESISAKVYPNPTNSQLNVQVFKVNEGFKLEIFDVMGRRLNGWLVPNNQATLSVEGLSAGLYYLRIDDQIVEKVVVGKK